MEKVCWIADSHYDRMRVDAKKYYPLETGGVLVGYVTKDGEYVVTEVILGGPKAERRPLSFMADTKWQREQCDAIWDKTHGTEQYIGDWHTHPDNTVFLSTRDVACLKVIADEPTCLDNPLMVVFGGPGFSRTGIYNYPETWPQQKMELKLYHIYGDKKEAGVA